MPGIATGRAFRNLWFEWNGLGGALFDGVSDHTFVGSNGATRALWLAALGTGWYFANQTWFVSNHELGHGSRLNATGLGATYAWNSGWGSHSNIYTFLGEGFLRIGRGAVTQSTGSARAFPSLWGSVVSAAGMNASQLFAEDLEDQIGGAGGHTLQAVAYFNGKSDPFFYALNTQSTGFAGDVSALVNAWNVAGYGVSTSEVMVGGAASLLGSFSTYAYLWSLGRYVATGDARAHAFRIGPVRLPDLSFFQNPSGPSYRLRTELSFASFSIPLSAEVVYRGAFTVEASAGFRSPSQRGSESGSTRELSYWLAKTYVNSALGVGVEGAKGFGLGQHFLLVLGAGFFTTRSLQGQRTMDFVLAEALGFNGWGRLSYVF